MNGNDRLREALQSIRGIPPEDPNAFRKARGIAYAALLAQEGAAAPEGEGISWPREAKRAMDGDGWVAVTRLAEHRMDKKQAQVWNACRAACIAAAGEPTR